MKRKKRECSNCGRSPATFEHDFSSVNPLCEDCYGVVCELWYDAIEDMKGWPKISLNTIKRKND